MVPYSAVKTLMGDVSQEISPDKIFCTVNTALFFIKAAFLEKYYTVLSL
jgi:hypothetical protein